MQILLFAFIITSCAIHAQTYERIPYVKGLSHLTMYYSGDNAYGIDFAGSMVYTISYADSIEMRSVAVYEAPSRIVNAATGKQGTILVLVTSSPTHTNLVRIGSDGAIDTIPVNVSHSIDYVVDIDEKRVLLLGRHLSSYELRGTIINSTSGNRFLTGLPLNQSSTVYPYHLSNCNTTLLTVVSKSETSMKKDTIVFVLDTTTMSWVKDSVLTGGTLWTETSAMTAWQKGDTLFVRYACDSLVNSVSFPKPPVSLTPLQSGEVLVYAGSLLDKVEAYRYTPGENNWHKDAFLSHLPFRFRSVNELRNGELVFVGDSVYVLDLNKEWHSSPFPSREIIPSGTGAMRVFSDSILVFSYNEGPDFLNIKTFRWDYYTTPEDTVIHGRNLVAIGNRFLYTSDTVLCVLDKQRHLIFPLCEVIDSGDTVLEPHNSSGSTVGFQVDAFTVCMHVVRENQWYSIDVVNHLMRKQGTNWKEAGEAPQDYWLGTPSAVVSFESDPMRVVASALSSGDTGHAMEQADTVLFSLLASTDKGTTWVRSTKGMPNKLHCVALASCQDTVYAAVTNILGLIPYPVYEQITIIVSTDRGQTWEECFILPVPVKQVVQIYVSNDGVVFVLANNQGCYFSTNRGYTWESFQGPWENTGGVVQSVLDFAGFRYVSTTVGLYRTLAAPTNVDKESRNDQEFTVQWLNGAFMISKTYNHSCDITVSDVLGNIIPVTIQGLVVQPLIPIADGMYIVACNNIGTAIVHVIR